ncbi:MAG: AAA family ATPase [Pseudomonadales bacterium]|nr:AAA family ATPase [Pseudomonadales bacterium]
MAKVIAVYNIKGGVGKTTSAVNLAYLAAQAGFKTLLWDMDHQAAAGFFLANDSALKGGLNGMMKDAALPVSKRSISAKIVATDYQHLDLLPSDISMRLLDVKTAEARGSNSVIKKMLEPLQASYDYIFVDCAPGLTVANVSLMHAADLVLVPVIPTVLSVRMLEQLNDFVKQDIHAKNAVKTPKLRAFFTMMDGRKLMHKSIYEQLCVKKKTIVLPISIPYQSSTEKMAQHQKPLAEFAGSSTAALAYDALWASIKRMRF